MNAYGQMAMRHWRKYRPVRYLQLADPVDFFRRLGEQIRDQAAELAGQPADTSHNVNFLDRISQLQAARLAAYRQAVRQLREDDPGE